MTGPTLRQRLMDGFDGVLPTVADRGRLLGQLADSALKTVLAELAEKAAAAIRAHAKTPLSEATAAAVAEQQRKVTPYAGGSLLIGPGLVEDLSADIVRLADVLGPMWVNDSPGVRRFKAGVVEAGRYRAELAEREREERMRMQSEDEDG